MQRQGAPEKKVPSGTPCLISRKAAILADFAQIITDFAHIHEVMAEFRLAMQQDRNTLSITRLQCRIGIGVEQFDADAKFLSQRTHSLFHVMA